MTSRPNLIAAAGKPLVFPLARADESMFEAPPIRLGDAVRTVVTSMTGFQKEALVRSTRSGDTWRFVSDEGMNLNGHDAAPPPLGYLSAGIVASYMTEISALARKRGVDIRRLGLTVDSYYSMTGSMPRRTMAGSALPVEVSVDIDCSLSGPALNQLLMDAIHASPVNGLLREPLVNKFRLARNGREIDAGSATPEASLLGESAAAATHRQESEDTNVLLRPLGPSPSAASVGSKASGEYSVKDAAGTLIHVGATGVLRPDGIKEIRQQLFAPHGTEWLFLSDEAVSNGGLGRAPDANSLISAGIGFCFMTQFGILIDVQKWDVERYQILQDTHFSLGGATGGTDEPGSADAVETHVHLTTSETEEVARDLLALAERACFLHALCGQKLKAKLRVATQI